MALDGKQRRHLRALGHHLEPVVQIGKHGVTDAVTAAVGSALERHELVKVRIGTECPDERDDVARVLGKKLLAEVAQKLGRTVLLYRRHPEHPKIRLPRQTAPG
jgi:RNA-binding protein